MEIQLDAICRNRKHISQQPYLYISIMSNSKRSVPDTSVHAAPHSYRYPTVSRGDAANTHSNKQPLLFAWTKTREVSDDQQSSLTDYVDIVAASEQFPSWAPHGQRDLGFWLLRSVFARRAGWSHLKLESLPSVIQNDSALHRCAGAIKRAFDIVLSIVLLILLLPACVVVAILVKLDSPGPVLFRHRRVGKDGKEFFILKFRSMRVDAPQYERSPISILDTRLTRIGKLIRRMSVDELPQLINVLKGEMSLVGPRPEMPFIVDRYSDLERTRLVVRPGITGLWQISPARALPIHENLQYDLHYIHHQNPILDCAILWRTVAAVIHGVGAI
jgi:lipopolysaccharide/colanic/teichoic acid biosynthesis glycosyltransferase